MFNNVLFKQEVVPAPVTAIFSSLSYSLGRQDLKYNNNNYTMRLLYKIMIICIIINNNKAIINNNYGNLQGMILLFKIAMGTRKVFFEIYGQFEQAS
jgi:hypothetical protein